MNKPLLIDLEFARAEQAGDPFAFRFAAQEYLLRSAGGGFESGSLSWNQKLLDDLGAARLPDRDPALLAQLGTTLRRFLLPMGWGEKEALILEAVAAQQPILFTIRSAAAELFALPWELLLIKSTGQHLGELPSLLIRYEWPETHSVAEPPARPEGGRILLAWSAAGGTVPAAEHTAAILQASRAGHHGFDGERDVLPNASLRRLDQTLQAANQAGAPFAVLHLLCHGGAIGSTFGLKLDSEDPTASTTSVDAARLRQVLLPYAAQLRLVVLSACDSGNDGTLGNQLGSIAQALHRAGIAAVVASRYPLSIVGSIALTQTLYQELLGGPAPLEQALVLARQRLFTDSPQLDWASLQLYARAEDGSDTRPVIFRPFRGLLAFMPEHRRFFFGRSREEDEIRDDLHALLKNAQPRFLIVAGASGTGKSSMLLAGVVPRLLSEPDARWELVRLRPGSEPQKTLDAALPGPTDRPLLVCVDQFEESATLGRCRRQIPRFGVPGKRLETAGQRACHTLAKCDKLVGQWSPILMERKNPRQLVQTLVVLAGVSLFACKHPVKPTAVETLAKANIEGRSGSTLSGEATFRQSGKSVVIHLQVKDAAPGQHGVHIHEKGDCSDIEAKSAGPHFNPTSAPHGGPGDAPHHAGDLGNLTVGADGTGVLDLNVTTLTLADGATAIAQRAIVIHDKTDDMATQPTGGSGGRVGCGVIEPSKAPPQ